MRGTVLSFSFVFLFLFITSSFSDTVIGPPPKQKILVLKGFEGIGLLVAALEERHTVDVMDSLPDSLSQYHQIWDVRFNQGSDASVHTNYLNGDERIALQKYMADSGSVFLLGENLGFPGRNFTTIDFVNTVIKNGEFAKSKSSVLNTNGSSKNAVLDSAGATAAEDFGNDFEDLFSIGNIWTEYPGGVRLNELAGGEAVYVSNAEMEMKEWQSNFDWPAKEIGAIAIAFTSDKLKNEYKNSKLFVLFDWQTAGAPGSPAINKSLFRNVADFLTRPWKLQPAQLLADPGDTIFNVASLDVELWSNADTILYSVNGGDTLLYSDPITISEDTTIIWAIAKGEGFLDKDSSWTYIRDLPDATLEADPGDTTFNIESIDVTLSTNADSIFYAVNDGDTLLYTGPITVSEDTTIIWAIAKGDSFRDKDSSWIYIKNLPEAKLEADPGDTTYDKASIDVKVSTNAGNTVFFTVDGSDPDSTSFSFVGDSIITIIGTQTLKALAVGTNYKEKDSSWNYISILPQLQLSADPEDGTHFESDTTIELTVHDGKGNPVDADIYYIIDSAGSGNYPDSTNGTLYTGEFTIDQSVTVWAVAYNKDFVKAVAKWDYILDDKATTLTASPSDSLFYTFGHTIDTILLQTNADSIIWLLSDESSDSSSVETSGKYYIDGDISIEEDNADTMYLAAIAFGKGFETIYREFVYVREYLPTPDADPKDTTGSAGYKFSGTLEVTLSVEGSWENLEIYYTTDGSDPSSSNGTKIKNNDKVSINSTLTLKAIAYADNVVESGIGSWNYILATGSERAWYVDKDADGRIDGATIALTEEVSHRPDSILFISPYDSTETVVVQKEDIKSTDDALSMKFPKPFTYYDTTHFDGAPLGVFYGDYYIDNAFEVEDSVGPLVRYAVYKPGRIKSKDPVVRASDTLEVTFSEKVTISDKSDPLRLLNMDNEKYEFRLSEYEGDGDLVRFNSVDDILGVDYPETGDSVKVHWNAGVKGLDDDVVQRNIDNKYGTLVVETAPYDLLIKSISPVDPAKDTIPDIFRPDDFPETGVLTIADFLVKIQQVDLLDAKARIYDKVGNVLLEADGLGSYEHLTIEVQDRDVTKIIFAWDGKNRNKRYVGSGSYLMKLYITAPLPSGTNGETTEIVRQISIGVLNEDDQ